MLNACRYSGSDTVNVAIDTAGGSLEVIVYDQGHGFDASQPQIKEAAACRACANVRASSEANSWCGRTKTGPPCC